MNKFFLELCAEQELTSSRGDKNNAKPSAKKISQNRKPRAELALALGVPASTTDGTVTDVSAAVTVVMGFFGSWNIVNLELYVSATLLSHGPKKWKRRRKWEAGRRRGA